VRFMLGCWASAEAKPAAAATDAIAIALLNMKFAPFKLYSDLTCIEPYKRTLSFDHLVGT
jgi:hypothetical protein